MSTDTDTITPHPKHMDNRVRKAIRLAEAAVANYDWLAERGPSYEWDDDIWLELNALRQEARLPTEATVAMTVGILMGLGL